MKCTAARALLGIIFMAASFDKIAHPVDFAEALANYRLLPALAIPLAALALPWVELLSGSMLALGLLTDSCALILACLSGLFALATTAALARGLDISCGCFHSDTSPLSWLHPVMDLVLLGLALFILRAGPGRWALDHRVFKE